jgi:fatty acid desaturase
VFGGILAFRASQQYSKSLSSSRTKARQVLLVGSTNAMLFGYSFWLGAPSMYILLWFLPLLTLTMFISGLRVIAEHQSLEYNQNPHEDWTSYMKPFTRTIPAGIIERFIFAPLNFCYHHEHHIFASIPYSQLPQLHKI